MDFSMKLNDNKAGLQGLDKDRINAIIQEASKDSLYSKHQEKRALRVQERIRQQQEAISKLSPEQIRISQLEMDRLAKQLEEERDLGRIFVHIDMDAYYAAVEMRDNPSLRDKPMAVGSISMLSTSNYIARRFGVRAAMAGYIGKKLCPQLIIVPCNFRKYIAVSEQVRNIVAEYDPDFVAIGLDEARMELTDYLRTRQQRYSNEGGSKRMHQRRRYGGDCICKLPRYDGPAEDIDRKTEPCEPCGKQRLIYDDELGFGHTPEEVTNEIRFRIEQETGLTASAGIAVNKMLAKVCADIHKPNGQYLLPPVYDTIMEFVKHLPIRKICGIGGVTESMLKAIGVETCGDLYEKRGLLALTSSPISSKFFLRVALGLGSPFSDSATYGDSDRKSIGVERTFAEVSGMETLMDICKSLCEKVVKLMEKESLKAKTVILKIKTVKFDVKTRARTLDSYVCDFEPIFNAATSSLRAEIAAAGSGGLRLRLMGIRLTSFLHETEANRLKLPEITRYLRQKPPNDESTASSSSPGKSKFLNADEDSRDSVLRGYSSNEDDEIIVLNDDFGTEENVASTSTAVDSGASFSDDVMEAGTRSSETSVSPGCLSSVVCPVCNCKFANQTEAWFNSHLDQCLNRKTISGLIKEQDKEFSASPAALVPPVSKTPKRKSGEKTRVSPSLKMKKIDDYFKPI